MQAISVKHAVNVLGTYLADGTAAIRLAERPLSCHPCLSFNAALPKHAL
jgi:hypothetical protein